MGTYIYPYMNTGQLRKYIRNQDSIGHVYENGTVEKIYMDTEPLRRYT